MDKQQRTIKYIKEHSELECLDFIQKQVRALKKYHKAREKSSETHINSGLTSRAKSTTTYSNRYNNARMFDQIKEDLKIFIDFYLKLK